MSESFLSRIDPPKPPKPAGPTVPPNDAYTKKAFEEEVDRVRNAPEGERNHQLFKSAAALAEFVNSGTLDEVSVFNAVADAARYAGLSETEIEATIRSAFNKTEGKTREMPERVHSPTASVKVHEEAPQAARRDDSDPFGDIPPIDGAEWMFETDDTVVELWGKGQDILWAEGEATMLCGPMGTGKSTIAGELVRAQLGLCDTVLDMPVMPIDRPILYLAMDRPSQIKRSMRRQFSEDERELIRGRLLVRPGPPAMDMAIDPTLLVRMAEAVGAGVVYIDSLKDAVVGLSADETAANYNRARQRLLAAGVEVFELHHVRKPTADGAGGISSVYGSTWLASGAGSVLLLSGEPGDLVVKLRHAKTPANEVGPLQLVLDPERGGFTVKWADLVAMTRNAGANGLTAEGAAQVLYECRRPSASEKKKAERQLDRLVDKGLLTKVDSVAPVWFSVDSVSLSHSAQ